jgi:hypothetical protein
MSATDARAEDPDDVETKVEVAVLGPSFGAIYQVDVPGFVSPPFLDQGPDVPWESRLKVVVPIDAGTTLAEVVDNAAQHFGISSFSEDGPLSVAETINGIGFWKPADDQSGAHPDMPLLHLGVNENGVAVWATQARSGCGQDLPATGPDRSSPKHPPTKEDPHGCRKVSGRHSDPSVHDRVP